MEDILQESSHTARILNSEIQFDYEPSPTHKAPDLRFDANISQDSNLYMLKDLKQELAGEYNLLDSIDKSLAKRKNGRTGQASKNVQTWNYNGEFLLDQNSQDGAKFFIQNDQFDLTQKYDENIQTSGPHNDSMKSLNNILNQHNHISPSFLLK